MIRKMKPKILMIVWLMAISLTGAGVAYAQYCFNEGNTSGFPTDCDYFPDDSCSITESALCESQHCQNSTCNWDGYSQHCRIYYYVCSPGTGCGGFYCA
jgi:hypothetical protein